MRGLGVGLAHRRVIQKGWFSFPLTPNAYYRLGPQRAQSNSPAIWYFLVFNDYFLGVPGTVLGSGDSVNKKEPPALIYS